MREGSGTRLRSICPPADPRLQLETLYIADARGRIVSTREPHPSPGATFVFIRGESQCAWAARTDVADDVARELDRLASDEPPTAAWDRPLRHGERYSSLLRGRIRSGPAFAFPEALPDVGHVDVITDEAELSHHFAGWLPGEIAAGRSPVLAIRDDEGYPISICFCARRSSTAAEAGIETAAAFRGRGYSPRVALSWARHVRALELVPMYSTDWSNAASLAVARKLRLIQFATDFNVDAG